MERGGVDYLRAVAVDSGGHYTQAAYDWCRIRYRTHAPDGRGMYTFACKGKDGPGDVWPRDASSTAKVARVRKVPLWIIKVDTAKELLYTRLSRVLEPGPSYIHFPKEFDATYYEQLAAEKLETTHDARGFPKRVWKLKTEGARNEALDTAVLSIAALNGLRAMGFDLAREAARLSRHQAAPTERPVVQAESPSVPPPVRRRRKSSSSKWMQR
jgi:phage terminase large subunit GpA-like protein